MLNNKRFLLWGMAVVAFSVLLCAGISWKLWLKQPVFLDNYLEVEGHIRYGGETPLYQEHRFQLLSVTSVDDSRTISAIEFPEYPKVDPAVSECWKGRPGTVIEEKYVMADNRSGFYQVKTYHVSVNGDIDLPEPVLLTRAIVLYSDGARQEVELGQILLQNSIAREGLFTARPNPGSDSGAFRFCAVADADISVNDIEITQLQGFSDKVFLTLNETDSREFAGLSVRQGSDLWIEGSIEGLADGGQFCQVNLSPSVSYEDEAGNEYVFHPGNAYYSPMMMDYTFFNLAGYLAKKGAL